MPGKPPRPCPTLGCHGLWDGRRCTVCGAKASRALAAAQRTDRPRWYAVARRWYTSARWLRARRALLAREPVCRQCAAHGETSAAEVVDHITPHRGDYTLFWDPENWQPLCKPCHDCKTALEVHGPQVLTPPHLAPG